jgi:hypothetical protein
MQHPGLLSHRPGDVHALCTHVRMWARARFISRLPVSMNKKQKPATGNLPRSKKHKKENAALALK